LENEDKNRPVVDVKGKKIVQIGIVVGDAPKTAKRYSEIFGIGPWSFLDINPTEAILNDKPLGDVDSSIRIALAHLGNIQIELLQPLYGPSTHMDFLQERGEGVHHISFGRVEDHDRIVSGLKKHGVGIEMQGLLGGAVRFTYMATQKMLGTIFEVVKLPHPGVQSTLKPWGTYPAPEKGLINMDGKEIIQVGIAVKDVEETARHYWEIFGIGPWALVEVKPPHVSDILFHGIPMNEGDLLVRLGLAQHENIQFELIEPVVGPGVHMDFLKTHGEGINHVSFGQVDDHDEVVSILGKEGMAAEWTGVLGGARRFTYMASKGDLGTIVEFLKANPDVKSTLEPYGTYPHL
jgi:hypothetical protein